MDMDIERIAVVYRLRHFKGSELVQEETATNLVPAEGVSLISDALFFGAAIPAQWYLGLYKTNYTPTPTVSAATINALAVESLAYSQGTRPAFVPQNAGVGVVNNAASVAQFNFSATETIYGGFLSSSPTKGAPAGVLLSVVKFPTVKNVDATSRLEVTGGLTLVSA